MKKIFRILAIVLVLAMMPMSLVACNKDDGNKPTEGLTEVKETLKETQKQTQKNTAKPTDKKTDKPQTGDVVINLARDWDKIKLLGRSTLSNDGVICDHSASGIEFRGTMKGDVVLEMVTAGVKNGCNTTYFTVYVDGERQPERLEVNAGENVLKIASFDDDAEHTIRFVKQTESNYTLCEIKTISFTSGSLATPPEDKELFIEVIGDSLTCGMGNVGTNSSPDPQTPAWEDATQSYGYILADKLGADYSIVSESGIGIAGSWFDPLFDFYTKASYSRDKEQDHVFSLRTPDVIIINLGTNDFYLNKDKDPKMCTPEAVTEKTKEFINLVRDSYGENVPIIWAYDFVGNCMYDSVKEAVDKLGGESAGIYFCKLPQNTGGAQWHPDVSGHQAAADTLFPLVKKLLGIE